MTERAKEDGAAPVLAEAGDLGHLVVHAGRQNQRVGADLAAAVAEHDDKAVVFRPRVDRLDIADLHRVVEGELLTRAGVKVVR